MLGFCCSGLQKENHKFTSQAEKMPGMRCKKIRTKHRLPRACLTPSLEGYGMDFSANKGRDQYHKGTAQRELVTCTITGKGLRPATEKYKGP